MLLQVRRRMLMLMAVAVAVAVQNLGGPTDL